MSFQPPKKKAAKSFAVPKKSVDSSGDGLQIVGKEPPLVKKKENVAASATSKPGFSKPDTVPPAKEKTTKQEKKVKDKKTNEPGSEQADEKKNVKKRKAKSENDESSEPTKPKKKKKPKKKNKENEKEENKSEGETKQNKKVKKVKDGKEKSKDGKEGCDDESKETVGIKEDQEELKEEQNEIEDHFEALLNDIVELEDEVDDEEEEPDENGIVLDIDLEALPDDIRLEVLKQTKSTTAATWRNSQEQGEMPLMSKKNKVTSDKTKKKKKKRSKSECQAEPCGTATRDENVDVFSPLESQETQDEIHEEQTEKKVKKKRKSKKPKKVTDTTEEDISGLMEPDDSGGEEGVKSLSPLEQLEAEIMKTELEEGTWVQCDNRWCRKWRLLQDVSDPLALPNKWTCDKNTDDNFNSCDIPEQTWDRENEDNFVYAEFTEGSIVWAKMDGYPWWPAMVQNDPDLRTFYESDDMNPMMPLYYHVVFLDKKQSRAWVRRASIKAFNCSQEEEVVAFPFMAKGQSYKKQRDFALQQAVIAAKMTIEEKVAKFGFKKTKHSKPSPRYHNSQMSMSDDDDFDVPKPKQRGSRKKRKVEGESMDDVIPVSKHGKSDLKKKVKKDKSRERADKDGNKIKKKKTRNDVEKPLTILPEIPQVDFKFKSSSQKSCSGSQNSSCKKVDNCDDNDKGDTVEVDLEQCDNGAEVDSESDADVKVSAAVSDGNIEAGSDKGVQKEGKADGGDTENSNVVEKTQEYDMEVTDATGDANVGKTGDEEKKIRKKKVTAENETEGGTCKTVVAENGDGKKKGSGDGKKKGSGDGKKKKSAKPKKKEMSESVIDGEKKLGKSKEEVLSEDGEKAVKPRKKKVIGEGVDGEKKSKKRVKKISEGVDEKDTGEDADEADGVKKTKELLKKKKSSDEANDAAHDVTETDGEKKVVKKKKSSEDKDAGEDATETDGEKKPKKIVKKKKDKDESDETVEKIEDCEGDEIDEVETDNENPVEAADGDGTCKDEEVKMCCDGGDKREPEYSKYQESKDCISNIEGKDQEHDDEVPNVDTKAIETENKSPAGDKPVKKRKKTVPDGANMEEKKKLKGGSTNEKKKMVLTEGGEVKEKKPRKKRVKSESEGEEKSRKKGKGEAVKTEVSVVTEELTRNAVEEESIVETVRAEDKATEKKGTASDSPESKSEVTGKKFQGSPCMSQPKVHCSLPAKSINQKPEKSLQKTVSNTVAGKKVHSSPAKAATPLKTVKKVGGPMDRFLVKPKSKFVAPVVGKEAQKSTFLAPVIGKSTENVNTDTAKVAVKTKTNIPKRASKLSLKKQKNADANSQKESSQTHEVKTVVEIHNVFDKDCLGLDLKMEAPKESSQCSVPDGPRAESPVMEFEYLEVNIEKPAASQALEISTRCDSPGFDVADNSDSQAMDVEPASPAMSVSDEDESQGMHLDAKSQLKHIEVSSSACKVVNES